jgi:ribosome-associated protein
MKLDQFLKFKGLAATGGQAKYHIQAGDVSVNGETETRRGRQLVSGDTVTFQGQSFSVEASGHSTP